MKKLVRSNARTTLSLDIEIVRPLRSLDDRELALVAGGGTTNTTRLTKLSSLCTI